LIQRGHTIENIILTLRSAAASIDNVQGNRKILQPTSPSEDTLYIPWQYHPTDIKKNTIREAYYTALKDYDNFSQMRIAMSRPNNLKDILCRTNLSDLPGRNASDILSSIRNVIQTESNITDKADD
jgi:hypothetical protein